MRFANTVVVLLVAALLRAAPLHVTRFDTNHSTIGFRIPILGGMSQVEGKFTDFVIDLTYDEEKLANSGVTATINAGSIDTGIADRDEHLRSPDFFDAAKYPEIKFVSSRIQKSDQGFVAHGILTMHGVSKPLALPFKQTGTRRVAEQNAIVLGFSGRVRLDRRDFGLNWKHSVDPLFVGDEVDVEIHLITKLVPLPER